MVLMALMPTTSLQTRTHRPQSMHCSWASCTATRLVLAPYSEASARISLLAGHWARSISKIQRRTFWTRGLSVRISMPSATGYMQEMTILDHLPCTASTTHRRQAPLGSTASWWHRVGICTPWARAVSSTV